MPKRYSKLSRQEPRSIAGGETDDRLSEIIGLGERSMRKNYYAELRQRLAELERFRSLFDSGNDLILLAEFPDAKIVDANQPICKALGFSRKDLLGMSLYDLVEDGIAIIGIDQHLDHSERTAHLVSKLRRAGGGDLDVELTCRFSGFGGKSSVLLVARDITERLRTEEALRDSERRIRLVTDAMPALIAYVDAEERYRFTNKAYEDRFGRSRSEIDGQRISETLGDFHYQQRHRFIETVLAGHECTFEIEVPSSGGGTEHLLATYVPHIGDKGDVIGFFALIQDITERKKVAQSLQEAKESLERRVEERTAELMASNEALREAKAEADQANLSKTKFLAAASHDLLQPLNAARVFIAALSERRMAPRNRSLVENISAALEAVDDLLTALLDISKLDAGVLYPEIRDFPISSLLDGLAAEHVMVARQNGLDLKAAHCSLTVRSDTKLLGRILRNFISNAIRYTPEGRILLGCRRRPGNKLLVGVWDTGIGVPEDKQKIIFEEFQRLDSASRRRAGDRGMGLGLAIVDRIAQKLGYEIVVFSQPGRGSLFGIEVPLGQPVTDEQLTALPIPAVRLDSLAGALLVVIDNERSILDGMAALLEGWRCTTIVGQSAQDALAALKACGRTPDIIIADYHLDDGQIGIDAVGEIQAYTGKLPALIITADRTPEVDQAVRAAGIHLLTKPVKPARLRSLLAHLLRERE